MITIDAKEVNFYYGDFHALKNITMEMERNTVTAFIGPSGCGKSTFLRLLNRMNDLIPGTRLTGEILIDGENIYARQTEVVELRKKVGMVFQKPNPFPKSIFENVAYGLRVNGIKDRALIAERVERSLQGAALWNEVKDKLKKSAFELSGGQQQRLCIARALAVEPSILLMDEPASALDHQDRRPDLRTEKRVYDRDRDAQHATGGTCQRPHGIFLSRRADRVRRYAKDIRQPDQRGHPKLRHGAFRLIPPKSSPTGQTPQLYPKSADTFPSKNRPL